MENHQKLVRRLAEACLQRDLVVSTAESCTGGGVAHAITEIPGSSRWFDAGLVTYSNAAKQRLLGVPGSILEHFGAVSEETVEAMAQGVLVGSAANLAVAVSGIAGPDGGSELKPVGTVWFAWAQPGREVQTALCHFDGDRQSIRDQAVNRALLGLIRCAEHNEAF